MLSAFANAFRTPDLRKKLLFTLGILVIFRFGSVLPVPNVNVHQIDICRAGIGDSQQAGIYSMVNLFSGGALLQLAVFALGIMPYITASIILQLLTVVIPKLEALKKEGGAGQQQITQYTRYLTLVLAVLQATAFTTLAVRGQLFPECQGDLVYDKGIFAMVVMVFTMVAGAAIVMWLGELITERGVGNGMSLLIFTQIAATFPSLLWGIKISASTAGEAQGWIAFGMVLISGLILVAAVIFIEQGQRRIPVQYARKMVGGRTLGGNTTYIPMKVNQAGVIPVIFASSIITLPMLVAQFRPDTQFAQWVGQYLVDGTWLYLVVFFTLIIAFTYFYVSITFNPEEVADNMKKYGGFVPGVRAGKPTERYLSYVLSRLTAPGSLYLAIIALIPSVAFMIFNAAQRFPFGGTSLLIIVGVGLDTVKQIESQLQQRQYEGFLR